jgi:hypothetical protein
MIVKARNHGLRKNCIGGAETGDEIEYMTDREAEYAQQEKRKWCGGPSQGSGDGSFQFCRYSKKHEMEEDEKIRDIQAELEALKLFLTRNDLNFNKAVP